LKNVSDIQERRNSGQKKITGNACDIKYAWDRNALMLRTGESGQKRYRREKRSGETEKRRKREAEEHNTGQRTCLCFWHGEKAFLNWNLNASEWQLTLAFV